MTQILIAGGGLGGLLLAHRLAYKGLPVTVLEKNRTFGGFNGRWDDSPTGAPLICYKALGLEASGSLLPSLAEHGAWDGVAPVRMEVCDHLFLPDGELALPGQLPELQALLIDRFPRELAGLETFFATLQEVYDSIRIASGVSSLPAQAKALSRLRTLGQVPYRDFLEQNFSDRDLRRILAVRIFSSENSVTTLAAYLAKILRDGLYALPESGSRLTDLLVGQLEAAPSCTLRPGFTVGEVLFDDELQAIGVRSVEGEVLRGTVVLGLDPQQLGREVACPAQVQRAVAEAVAGAPASLSALNVVFALTPDLGRALRRFSRTARLFHCDAVDLFEVLARREAGAIDLSCCKLNLDTDGAGLPVRVYAELDCAPGALGPRPTLEGTSGVLRSVLESLWTRLERVERGFRDGVSGTRILTPEDFARITHNTDGAASGFRDTPHGPRRLHEALARHDLMQIGQWSSFGSGLSQLEIGAVAAFRTLRQRTRGESS